MDDKTMDIYKYGSSQTPVVLIQMVGEHDLPGDRTGDYGNPEINRY